MNKTMLFLDIKNVSILIHSRPFRQIILFLSIDCKIFFTLSFFCLPVLFFYFKIYITEKNVGLFNALTVIYAQPHPTLLPPHKREITTHILTNNTQLFVFCKYTNCKLETKQFGEK